MDIAIIGGGAAGCFAAAQIPYKKGRKVTLFEKGQKLLQKVSISGGGRCNLTHDLRQASDCLPHYPRGKSLLRRSLYAFGPQQTMDWFHSRGLAIKTESDGRVFPQSDRSESVIEILLAEMERNQVDIQLGAHLKGLVWESGRFKLSFVQGPEQWADQVLVACGGLPSESQYHWIKAMGLDIESPVPSIFSIHLADHPLVDLAGVSVPQAEVKIKGAGIRESGPLLITHWGLSGPAILRASAFGARWMKEQHYAFPLAIQWIGGMGIEEVRHELDLFGQGQGSGLLTKHSPLNLPRRLWTRLLERAGQDAGKTWAEWGGKGRNQLAQLIHHDVYHSSGRTAYKDEFVTAGGLKLEEIDLHTLGSKKWPGLYFAGEILDVDGVTGGFNFQHAWSSGFLAAQQIIQYSASPGLPV